LTFTDEITKKIDGFDGFKHLGALISLQIELGLPQQVKRSNKVLKITKNCHVTIGPLPRPLPPCDIW
jgi:hypothetical protein